MSAVGESAGRGASADALARSYSVERVFPIFTVAFGLIYFWGVYTGICFLRYYPAIGRWSFGYAPLPASANAGPGMMWYWWVMSGIIGGAVVAGLSLLLPKDQVERLSARWAWVAVAITSVLIVAVLILLRGYFIT